MNREARMIPLLRCSIVTIGLATSVAYAQESGTPPQGQPIRVAHRCRIVHDEVTECRDTRSPRIDTGQLQGLDRDTLRVRVQPRGTALAIPTTAVAQVWMVDGTRGHFWTGAAIGLIGGMVIGGVIGSTQDICILGCSPATGLGIIAGAPLGFLVGGVVGAVIRSDRWRPASLDGDRITVKPRLDTIGVSVSVAF